MGRPDKPGDDGLDEFMWFVVESFWGPQPTPPLPCIPPTFGVSATPFGNRLAFKACHGGSSTRQEDGALSLRREMPKLKTKSGVKKRFKMTASGKLKAGVAGKRHRLISHNAKYIRQNRGTKVMSEADAKIIKVFMPYGL